MDELEKIKAAQRMQDHIHRHIDEDITLEGICEAAGYSKRHAFRIFREAFQKTPFEYIRALRLTNAARSIKNDSGATILEVAVKVGFGSHEGFTKAFRSRFGVNPGRYRRHIPRRFMYFEPPPVLRSHLLRKSKEYIEMAETQRTVTVTVIEKPAGRLILKRGITSQGYFEYCEEMGCDVFEILETVSNGPDKAVFIELPPCMITPGTSRAAAALEVPIDFNGDIPEGFEIIELPSHLYMCFNGAPYEDENWFGEAHRELYRAIDNYKPELYGYEYAKDSAPVFNHFASAKNGVREIIPVKRMTAK